MRCCLLVICVLLMAWTLSAQATNDAQFAMVINDVDGVAPNSVAVAASSAIEFSFAGTPEAPFLLGFAAGLSVGAISAGGIQIDIGPSIAILLDGNSPITIIDLLARLPLSGATTLAFSVPSNILPGSFGAFQALAFDPTAPTGLSDSAATDVTIEEEFDYGELTYLFGGDLNVSRIASGPMEVGPLTNGVAQSNLVVNRHTDFHASTEPFVFKNDSPALRGAFTVSRRSGAQISFAPPFSQVVRTVHGDILQLVDATGTTGASSLFLLEPGQALPTFINGSLQLPVSGSSFWQSRIAVSEDQSIMAAVTQDDRVFMFRIDGGTFASNGMSFAEVTPTSAPDIRPASLRITSNRVYFAGQGSTIAVYSASRSAPTSALPLNLPLLGNGNAVANVDADFFHHAPSDAIFVNALFDILKITDTSATATVINVTDLTLPNLVFVSPFGDSHSGRVGRFDVSPDGQRCAYCLRTNIILTLENLDLYWISTDGLGAPHHLTSDSVFEPGVNPQAADGLVLDVNFYGNNDLMAFVGEGCVTSNGFSATDLYNFDLSTPGLAVLTNITQTNGQSGSTLPILAAMPALITPGGVLRLSDRVLFRRIGLIGMGPQSRDDLVGVDYLSLTPYDITGTEFTFGVSPLPTEGPCGSSSTPVDAIVDLQFAANADELWFRRSLANQFDNLFAFDSTIVGPAIPATNFSSPGPMIDNLVIDPGGGKAYFAMTIGGQDEEIHLIDALVGIPQQLTDDGEPNTKIAASSLRLVRSMGTAQGIVYAASQFPLLADQEVLFGLDLSTSILNPIDDRVGQFDILTGY